MKKILSIALLVLASCTGSVPKTETECGSTIHHTKSLFGEETEGSWGNFVHAMDRHTRVILAAMTDVDMREWCDKMDGVEIWVILETTPTGQFFAESYAGDGGDGGYLYGLTSWGTTPKRIYLGKNVFWDAGIFMTPYLHETMHVFDGPKTGLHQGWGDRGIHAANWTAATGRN